MKAELKDHFIIDTITLHPYRTKEIQIMNSDHLKKNKKTIIIAAIIATPIIIALVTFAVIVLIGVAGAVIELHRAGTPQAINLEEMAESTKDRDEMAPRRENIAVNAFLPQISDEIVYAENIGFGEAFRCCYITGKYETPEELFSIFDFDSEEMLQKAVNNTLSKPVDSSMTAVSDSMLTGTEKLYLLNPNDIPTEDLRAEGSFTYDRYYYLVECNDGSYELLGTLLNP
jgi:hypothetical protein